jgi:hypothetical protein
VGVGPRHCQPSQSTKLSPRHPPNVQRPHPRPKLKTRGFMGFVPLRFILIYASGITRWPPSCAYALLYRTSGDRSGQHFGRGFWCRRYSLSAEVKHVE